MKRKPAKRAKEIIRHNYGQSLPAVRFADLAVKCDSFPSDKSLGYFRSSAFADSMQFLDILLGLSVQL